HTPVGAVRQGREGVLLEWADAGLAQLEPGLTQSFDHVIALKQRPEDAIIAGSDDMPEQELVTSVIVVGERERAKIRNAPALARATPIRQQAALADRPDDAGARLLHRWIKLTKRVGQPARAALTAG